MPSTSPAEQALASLEQRIGTLVSLCNRLLESNQLLAQNRDRLQRQHRELRRRNDAARDAIEKVVRRIKPYGEPR